QSPCRSKKVKLLTFADESKKLHAIGKVKRARQRLELGAIVAPAGYQKARISPIELCERLQHEVHPLVALQPAEIRKRGGRCTRPILWSVLGGVDTRIDHPNAFSRYAAGNQVNSGALADRLEGRAGIRTRQRPLGQPHGGCEGCRSFLENSPAKEVRNQRNHRPPILPGPPPGREKRNLVDVFHQDIRRPIPEQGLEGTTNHGGEGVPGAHPSHANSVHHGRGCTARPAAAKQAHVVTRSGETPEYLVQVNFGATRLRVLPVLPVDQEYAHGGGFRAFPSGARVRRALRSRSAHSSLNQTARRVVRLPGSPLAAVYPSLRVQRRRA